MWWGGLDFICGLDGRIRKYMSEPEIKEVKKTIAELLDGKEVDSSIGVGKIEYNPLTNTFTFEDGSNAYYLTKLVRCKPYIAADLSTSSVKKVRIWKVKYTE